MWEPFHGVLKESGPFGIFAIDQEPLFSIDGFRGCQVRGHREQPQELISRSLATGERTAVYEFATQGGGAHRTGGSVP
jgi:hypothetical protein